LGEKAEIYHFTKRKLDSLVITGSWLLGVWAQWMEEVTSNLNHCSVKICGGIRSLQLSCGDCSNLVRKSLVIVFKGSA
jgi:hypothetical protein